MLFCVDPTVFLTWLLPWLWAALVVVSSSKCPDIYSTQSVGRPLHRSPFFSLGEELSLLVLCPRNPTSYGLLRFGEFSGLCLASLTVGHGVETLSRELVSWGNAGRQPVGLVSLKDHRSVFPEGFSRKPPFLRCLPCLMVSWGVAKACLLVCCSQEPVFKFLFLILNVVLCYGSPISLQKLL